MIELELRDHEQTLLNGKLFLLFPLSELTSCNIGCNHSIVVSTSLLLPQKTELVGDE